MKSKFNSEDKYWYAIYTRPRAEKKVYEQLERYGYQAYLPLKKEFRQWKDRLKKVEVPLFNSYVFVKLNSKEYFQIPKLINGFVRFVTIGGQKVRVREDEINAIKQLLDYNSELIDVSNEDFKLNDSVEIKQGKLKGYKGKLVEIRGKTRIAIRVETISTYILVEISRREVKKVNK